MPNYIKCNCCIRFRTMFNYNFRLHEFIFYFLFANLETIEEREENERERGNNAHSKLINNCSNAWQTFLPFVREVFNI